MPSLFEWVLRSSAMASIFIGFILLFKRLIKDKLGAKWHYYIWFLVLLRLLIPFAPQSSLSVYNLFTYFQQKEASPIIVSSENTQDIRTGYVEEQARVSELPQDSIAFPENKSVLEGVTPEQAYEFSIPNINTLGILSYIWLMGLLIIALYTISVNLLFWLKIKHQDSISDQGILKLFDDCKGKMGISKDVPLIETDRVKTTTLFGFSQPRLLLPPNITKKLTMDELRYIFFHELAHIKQKDIIINWVVGLAQIIHWFNPMIWYAFYRMRQDREVACDALALSYLYHEDYKKYGQVIIKLLEGFAKQTQVPGMIGVVGSNNSNIKKRVTMIALFKKNSHKLSAIAIVFIILFTVVFLTNASGAPIVDGLEKEESEDEVVEKPEEIRGNTTGNIANGGLIAYQGDWIYYSNPEDEGRLYKKRPDGSEVTLLSKNSAMDINVVGDWVFYNNSRIHYAPGGNVYKVRPDGSDETRLNDHYSSSVQVVEDRIYYSNYDVDSRNFAIFKMRTDGSEQTMIIDRTAYNLNVVDGWVYFIESDGYNDIPRIYKGRTDGSDITLLFEGQAANLIVEGGWMYYQNYYNLNRTKTDGSSRQILSFEETHVYNVDGDWIYYVNISEGWWNIYRMRNDGSNRERINNERSAEIFTAGDWIYYLSANNYFSYYRKISKDIPGQTSLRDREDVSSSDVKDEIWQKATAVLGEASSRGQAADGPPSYEGSEDSGISWVIYDKFRGYAQITYRMSAKSNRMDQLLEQGVQEISTLFAELAAVSNIDYLIDDMRVEVLVYDTNGVWRDGINIWVDGETLINADWSNPSVELNGNMDEVKTFSSWWIDNDDGILPIYVQEENGTAIYVVEL